MKNRISKGKIYKRGKTKAKGAPEVKIVVEKEGDNIIRGGGEEKKIWFLD
jgi:hypothetical protein